MIKDRPRALLADDEYRHYPSLPIAVDFGGLPDLIKRSIADLGGVQPVTGAMANAAGGNLFDRPSPGEIELHRAAGSKFQMVSIVASVFGNRDAAGVYRARPYALSLVPASKRGQIDERNIDLVAALDIQEHLALDLAYLGFDPFQHDWNLYGPLSVVVGPNRRPGFVDEIGLVVGSYFLTTTFDPSDVLTTPIGIGNEEAERKYGAHRSSLLFRRFNSLAPRRVWGLQSPIELFLAQELSRRGVLPQLQMMIMPDGRAFPSLYDLWNHIEFRVQSGCLTEADLYFPDRRIAVFCDSTKHHRGKARLKDERINQNLAGLGISAVRVPGPLIVDNIVGAGDLVEAALNGRR